MKETVPFWFYRKLVWSNAKKYQDKADKLFTLQNIANLHLEGGLGGGGGGCKVIWRIVRTSEKLLAMPLPTVKGK